jgi:hypothetical protein
MFSNFTKSFSVKTKKKQREGERERERKSFVKYYRIYLKIGNEHSKKKEKTKKIKKKRGISLSIRPNISIDRLFTSFFTLLIILENCNNFSKKIFRRSF